MPRTTRTMYMHTLDGKPASYGEWHNSPAISFGGGRYRVQLVPTLHQIRREQRAALREARRIRHATEVADPFRYDYVLVEVPR